MASSEYAPTTPPPTLGISPVMIAMIGIFATAIAIATYHFLAAKYCAREHQTPLEPTGGMSKNGVDEKILESIPIRAYTIEPIGSFRVDQMECAVCISELEEGDPIRLLPNCNHAFHLECIDQWFYSHSNCPLCRSPIVGPAMPDESPSGGGDGPQLISQSLDYRSSEIVSGASQNTGLIEAHKKPKGILHPCASLLMPIEGKTRVKLVGLTRSLSMDCSYVSIAISKDVEHNSSSSSSSSSLNAACLCNNTFKGGSFRHFDRASSALTRNFSWLRIGHNGGMESGCLPV